MSIIDANLFLLTCVYAYIRKLGLLPSPMVEIVALRQARL